MTETDPTAKVSDLPTESETTAPSTANENRIPSPSVRDTSGRVPTFGDYAKYSFMETHKIKQTSASNKIPYSIHRGVKAISIPAGLAQNQEILVPSLSYQHLVDVASISRANQIASYSESLKSFEDPASLLPGISLLIREMTGPAPAFKLFGVSEFKVTEGGRTVIPAWGENAEFQMDLTRKGGKAVPPEVTAACNDYIRRWGTQYAVVTDSTLVEAAAARALRDATIAHMLAAVMPGVKFRYIEPTSVIHSEGTFKPKWVTTTNKHAPKVLAKMLKVQKLVLDQVSRELATKPDREKFTDEQAQKLFATDMISMYMAAVTAKYGDTVSVYCGGFIDGTAIEALPDIGTQAFLADVAVALHHMRDLMNTPVDATSSTFEDPEAPEPYFADLFAQMLEFATHLDEFLGTSIKRAPIGAQMFAASAADRYNLRMKIDYYRQTYMYGSLSVGQSQASLIVPTYGVSDMMNVASYVAGGSPPDMGMEIDGLLPKMDRSQFNPSCLDELPIRTTESPLTLCIMEEKKVSPYLLSAASGQQNISKASEAFNMATEVFKTCINGYTYLGNGFAPYRANFNNAEIFLDTGMYKFDKYFSDYLRLIEVSISDGAVYIPMGTEQARRGGFTLENVVTYYTIKPTNPAEELTLTGDMIFLWSHEITDLLHYQATAPISRTSAPYLSR